VQVSWVIIIVGGVLVLLTLPLLLHKAYCSYARRADKPHGSIVLYSPPSEGKRHLQCESDDDDREQPALPPPPPPPLALPPPVAKGAQEEEAGEEQEGLDLPPPPLLPAGMS
jgi:hypothetical protein